MGVLMEGMQRSSPIQRGGNKILTEAVSFDYFLSEALAPADKFDDPTFIAQDALYRRWRGFAPPGTCTLVPLEGTSCEKNKYGCKYIALCPTMRVPQSVKWDREVVYECMWSLLVEIDNHNQAARSAISTGQPSAPLIKSVVMPGLATGVGGVSVNKCAKQMALAIKQYDEAVSDSKVWSRLDWETIFTSQNELVETHNL